MGYTIWGKHLKIGIELIEVGDTVSVIDIDVLRENEISRLKDKNISWPKDKNISIGDKFIVQQIHGPTNDRWIKLYELYYFHPIEKFKKVKKNI